MTKIRRNPSGKRKVVITNWYGFQVNCKLFEHGQSNMLAPSRQQWCLRKDRHGNYRPRYDNLRCSKSVCPVLNGKIEMTEQQTTCIQQLPPKKGKR